MHPEPDNRPDVRVAQLAATQWSVLSLAELRECGLSPTAVRRRVRRGWLHPVHRGVYGVGHPPLTLEARFLAAVKACGPRAVLSHYAAAALWGCVRWDDRRPEVTVPGTSPRGRPGLVVHRTLVLPPRDMTRQRGIPVTSPARTLVDLAGIVAPRQLRRAVREAQASGRVTQRQLAATLERLGPRHGTAGLRDLLAGGPAPTRSELEDAVLALVSRGGLAPPDVNVPLRLGGRTVVPDFRWPAQRLVVEADGAAWHDHKLTREDDAERQALLEAHGERVLRVTWHQVVRRPSQTLARLRRRPRLDLPGVRVAGRLVATLPTNLEIIQRMYAPHFRVWDTGVLDHMYEHAWHPDIDWRAIEGAPDDVGVMHGRDRLRRYYEEWLELFDDITIEASEINEAGEHVVARARVSARSRSGIQTELNFAVVYTLLDGKVRRGREYASWDEALAAVPARSAQSLTS